MCRRTCVVLLAALMLFALLPAGANAAEKPYTGRTWEYVNVTLLLSPNWAFMVMPGHRFDTGGADPPGAKETFLWNCSWPHLYPEVENLTFKLPLWYYYGFTWADGNKNSGRKYRAYSHNIEVVRFSNSTLTRKITSRTIFITRCMPRTDTILEPEKGFSSYQADAMLNTRNDVLAPVR